MTPARTITIRHGGAPDGSGAHVHTLRVEAFEPYLDIAPPPPGTWTLDADGEWVQAPGTMERFDGVAYLRMRA